MGADRLCALAGGLVQVPLATVPLCQPRVDRPARVAGSGTFWNSGWSVVLGKVLRKALHVSSPDDCRGGGDGAGTGLFYFLPLNQNVILRTQGLQC